MTDKPWVHNKPEARLQIAAYRFLDRALLPPRYFTFLHDSDGGGRSDLQRIRDANRGITTGQLDGDVVQGSPLIIRKLELKRGRNNLSPKQIDTVAALTACGAPPIIAWTLAEVYDGLVAAEFRFAPNAITTLRYLEAQLEGWDREAEAIMSGEAVRKVSAAPRGASRQRVRPGLNWKLPV